MFVTRKAQELDVVELAEDLPEYGLKRGERGAVIAAFEHPDEAYDLEFVSESGESTFAYSVKAEQIRSTEDIAKEQFEHALELINQGRPVDAERAFQEAIDLKPALIVNLHNLILNIYETTRQWDEFIVALRLVLRINPDFEVGGYNMSFIARDNLAMAYQNYAAQKANEGDLHTAITYFGFATGIGLRPETISLIRRNLSRAYTSLGIQAARDHDYEGSVARLNHACEIDSNNMTRQNLGVAFVKLAENYLKQGDYENATSTYEHAVDLGLTQPEVLNNYGIALAGAGQYDEAVLTLRRALRTSPSSEVVEHNLSMIKRGTNSSNLGNVAIEVEFHPAPPMEQRSYSLAA